MSQYETDLDFRVRLRADDALQRIELFPDFAAQAGDLPGDVFERKKLLRVNRAVPDKFVVDVGEKAFADFDSRPGEHKGLKRDVGQMDFFLQLRVGFDLNQIPRITGNRHEDVRAGVAAVKNKRGFIQRTAGLNRLLGFGDDFVGIDDAGRDHDAAGKKLSRQFADFRALIKDGLR